MKKFNGLKKAVMMMVAAGMLCACGSSSQPESRGSVEERPEPSVAAEPTAAAEPNTGTEPEKERVTGSIVTTEVESVQVRYYNGYNIATGDVISDTIPCHTVLATGDELAKMSEILPDLQAIRANPGSEEYSHLMYDFLKDEYELIINGDLVLEIGREYGYTVSGGDTFRVPSELYEIVESIAEEYNNNNVYSTLDTDRLTITSMKGKEMEITDQDQLDDLLSIIYYPINADDDSFSSEKVAYVIDLHNGDQLDIFFASVLGKFRYADGSYQYVYMGEMEDYLNKVFAD